MKEMTDWQISAKHYRIRGSDELKYPANESRCRNTCGHPHDQYQDRDGHPRYKEHRCFLGIGHREKFCEFSSVCGEVRVRAERVEIQDHDLVAH